MRGSKATIPLLVLAIAFGVTLAVYFWPAFGPQVAGIAVPPNAVPPGPSTPSPSTPSPSTPSPSTAGTPPPNASPPVVSPSIVSPPAPAVAPPAAPATVDTQAPQTATSAPPQFDVVRVEPNGETVIAGKGAPNAKMEALASGKVVGEATADGSGQFVILPPPFRAGNYDLTLRQTVDGAATDSTQSVAVSVPAKGGEVVVALAEPGKPTRLLGGSPPAQPPAPSTEVANAPPDAVTPEAAPAPAPPPATSPPASASVPSPVSPPKPALAIRSVELENGNGFFVSGTAAPNTRVQIYLNASHLADVTTGADGQWSLTIKQGLTAGHYAVRADASGTDVKGAGGAVTARAEVPFDVPAAMAQAPAPPAAAPTPPPPAAPATTQTTVAPSPPSAPNPSEVAGLGPEKSAAPPAAPLPRPDIAAAAPKAPVSAPAPAASASITSPPAVSPPTAAAPPEDASPAAPTANAVIEQVETAVVVRGDNLWNISRARLGHGRRFTQIYEANASQIRDPRLIYPGQVFVMPKK